MPEDITNTTTTPIIMNTSPMGKLFAVLSWYSDEEPDRFDDPAALAAYLADVAARFDYELGDDDWESSLTYARPEPDFFMWDALGSWPHRDGFLEHVYVRTPSDCRAEEPA